MKSITLQDVEQLKHVNPMMIKRFKSALRGYDSIRLDELGGSDLAIEDIAIIAGRYAPTFKIIQFAIDMIIVHYRDKKMTPNDRNIMDHIFWFTMDMNNNSYNTLTEILARNPTCTQIIQQLVTVIMDTKNYLDIGNLYMHNLYCCPVDELDNYVHQMFQGDY